MSLKIGIGILLACFVAVQGFYPLQLEGGVIEKLYFTNIYIGTPPQKFTVHVDTGSGRLAVNCQGCKNCQTHPNPPLDISKSSSASLLNCVTLFLLRWTRHSVLTVIPPPLLLNAITIPLITTKVGSQVS
jgi:hypothetical protein